jgi:hypothetical protein
MFLVTWSRLEYYNINSVSAKIFHFSQFPQKRLHLQHLIRNSYFYAWFVGDFSPGHIGGKSKMQELPA